MDNLLIDFTWKKSSQYTVAQIDAHDTRGLYEREPVPWDYLESRFLDPDWGRDEWQSDWGLSAGGPIKSFRPTAAIMDSAIKIGLHIDKCRRTAQRKNSAAAELEFRDTVRRIVPKLTKQMGFLGPGSGGWEEFERWIDLGSKLSKMFRGAGEGLLPVANYGVFLRRGSRGPSLTLRPMTLESAISLHAAQSIARGTMSRLCEECGAPFLAGGGTGKKVDARFCTDKCRWAYNNNRKKARA